MVMVIYRLNDYMCSCYVYSKLNVSAIVHSILSNWQDMQLHAWDNYIFVQQPLNCHLHEWVTTHATEFNNMHFLLK